MSVDFSIITPSYNMLDYLKRCHASIMDQGVNVEHIVIDGGSTDGTVEWLKEQKDLIFISEKDDGMYDAINKGLNLSKGENVAYLNCDEQYLPGTLKFVKKYFESNPIVDVIFGNFLVINSNGELIAYRKSHQPYKLLLLSSYLYVFTCTMFFKRKIIDEDIYFDTKYKSVSDLDFILKVMEKGFKVKHLQKYFSAFIHRNNNLMYSENSLKETKQYLNDKLGWLYYFYPFVNIIRLVLKFFSGAYREKSPLKYEIFTLGNTNSRKEFVIQNPNFRMRKSY